jgi:hypothetical protein
MNMKTNIIFKSIGNKTQIKNFNKTFIRSYHTSPITYPSPLKKPVNPWDNMDPGRLDRNVNDEYDK